MFSCEFRKISKSTSGRLLLLLAFQRQPLEVFYEKWCYLKFCKIHRKTTLVCEIFKNTFFTEHPGRMLLAFSCNITKMEYCQQCLEKLINIHYLARNTNLRSTVQVYCFFFGSINFQCMFSLVYTVYCQKQS